MRSSRGLTFTAVAVALTIGGCTSTTPQGAQVRVTSNPDVVAGCQYLGEVKGADHMWGGAMGQGKAESNAYKRLKNNAAEMGANVVLMSTDETGMSGSTKRGEAYKCAESGS